MSEQKQAPPEADATSATDHPPEEAEQKESNVPYGAIFITTSLSLLILTAWFSIYALNFARS